MSQMQARNWMFTINNPMYDNPQDDPGNWDGVKYLIYQLEEGENGTPHFQGYVCFHTNHRLSALKKLNSRAHWELRMGTHEEAKKYCSKEETRLDGPYEFGVEPTVGGGALKKSKYDEMHELVLSGASAVQIMDTYPSLWYRHRSNILATISFRIPNRDFQTEVIVYWGPTGVGKSRRAIYEAKQEFGDDFYLRMKGDWWDGYEGQKAVIINDFYGWIQYDEMLRLLDRYPHQVPFKGGYMKFVARKVWITSNEHPQNWYPKVYERFPYEGGALQRRLMEPNGRVVYMEQIWTEEHFIPDA